MKITIEIPEEFEIDYKTDKFKDFFQRVLADMDYVCGNYERETAEMLIKAFESSNPVKEAPVKDEECKAYVHVLTELFRCRSWSLQQPFSSALI